MGKIRLPNIKRFEMQSTFVLSAFQRERTKVGCISEGVIFGNLIFPVT